MTNSNDRKSRGKGQAKAKPKKPRPDFPRSIHRERAKLLGGQVLAEAAQPYQWRGDVAAVVSDDPVSVDVPVWPRSNVAALADRVLALSKSARS